MPKKIIFNRGDKIKECTYLQEEPDMVFADGKSRRACRFRCKCGKEFISLLHSVTRGKTEGCGCIRLERIHESLSKHNDTHSKEYNIWSKIKARCYKPSIKEYRNYGARGIKMCDRWRNSYANFLADMGRCPSPKHSIDRINNDGDYEPSNCRWATKRQQSVNRRNNLYINYNGEVKTLVEWCEHFKIHYKMAHERLRYKNMSFEDVIKKGIERGTQK
jgi:hypothetical protein